DRTVTGVQTCALPISDRCSVDHAGLRAELIFERTHDTIAYRLQFTSAFATRLRLRASMPNEKNLFHLIPGNIHGDNNAAHVRARSEERRVGKEGRSGA